MDLDGVDPRRPAALPAERAPEIPVLVIGCGESGVLAGVRLRQANIPFTIVEKNAGSGGTWWENSYPGARVDVANHFYCYSFEPNTDWTHFFAEQHELQDYFTQVMKKHDLDMHVRWNTEVVTAEWNDDDGVWSVVAALVRRPDQHGARAGADHRGRAAESSAYPRIRGRRHIRGAIVSLRGLGSFCRPDRQAGRADRRRRQRLPDRPRDRGGRGAAHHIPTDRPVDVPKPMYHDEVGDGVRWAMRHLPYYGRWYRFLVLWPGSDKGLDAAQGDPNYADQDYAVSDINAAARMMFSHWITSQVGEGSDLLAKVMPDYPATGKRTLQDNGSWLQTLQRDNVELVRTPIERITPGGVVTEDGVTHDADVIVYATGFRHTDVLCPLKVTGRNGTDLHGMWGSRPYAYLGITVPEFPNFFIIYGPGTHLAHGGSLIFQSELQMRYVDQLLQRLVDDEPAFLEPTAEAATRWHQQTQAKIKQMVWSHPAGQTLLLQERRRRDPHRQPVAPQRVLGRGARTGLVAVFDARKSMSEKKASQPCVR